MGENHHYDVIIIGIGVGGGMLVYCLVPFGKKILLLERGDFVPWEKQNWDLCIRCATCDGSPCLVHAKADAQVICVEPALEHSNVTLLTKSKVTRLETDSSGRVVTKVHVDHDGASETYSANVVVSSCGAVNSAALMLRSAND